MPEESLQKPHRPGRGVFILLAGLLALSAGLYAWLQLAAPTRPQQAIAITTKSATLLPQLKALPAFSLQDQQGVAFDNQRLAGHWTFLSFGYTHCPDICPSTLALLVQMHERLQSSKLKSPYRIAFVSIDPERDTQQRLAEYIDYFEPSFLGVTGNREALQQLTKPLGILYQKVETPNSAMGYVMDHSASIILIDPDGRYHALFSPPHDAQLMADDFMTIARAYR